MRNKVRNLAIFLGLLALISLPALADRTEIRPAWNLFNPQQDTELGRILADDFERTVQLAPERNANTYIDALGKQLAAYAPGTKYNWQFKIVNDDSLNVWALPGGYIYVTSGVIQAAQNEPQLAGALAHALAHIALRHGTAEVSQQYADRVGNSRGRISVNDAVSRLNLHFANGASPFKYTREEERQANVVATQIMWDAGFDANQMVQMLQTMTRDRSNRTADFFATHPEMTNAGAIVRTEVRNLGGAPRTARGDSPDFHAVKDRLAANGNGFPPVYDARSTRSIASDQPSTRTVSYRGRDIEFRYPENWRVSENGDSISVAPDNGFVSGSLALGLSIATFDPQGSRYFGRNSFSSPGSRAADNTTLSNATDQLIDHLRQSNPNMSVIRNTERTRVDGAQAMIVRLRNDSPLGGSETDWVVTVLRPNGLLRYFVGVAPQRDFNAYQTAFEDIVASVRFLD